MGYLPNGKRPESGPMQFGADWPGVFFRGDEALAKATILREFLSDEYPELIKSGALHDLIETLSSCRMGG